MVKQELISSILEIEYDDKLELDDVVKHKKELQKAITLIKR